jgi:hypothetical protein
MRHVHKPSYDHGIQEPAWQPGNLNITVAILAALFTLLALGVAITGDAGVVAAH